MNPGSGLLRRAHRLAESTALLAVIAGASAALRVLLPRVEAGRRRAA